MIRDKEMNNRNTPANLMEILSWMISNKYPTINNKNKKSSSGK